MSVCGRIAAFLAAIPGLASGAEMPGTVPAPTGSTTECLPAETQAEYAGRMKQVMMVEMAGPMITAMMTVTAVTKAHEGSAAALAECEAAKGECDDKRAALGTASARLAEVKAQQQRQRRELSARITARIQSIRAEYPSCPQAPTPASPPGQP